MRCRSSREGASVVPRYRSDAEPLMQVVCHCETCRKNSGSAFSMNVAVPLDSLRIETGSPRRYEDHNGNAENLK